MLGTSTQADLVKTRKRIDALVTLHFPKCPICKAEKGYNIHGFLAYTQYAQCKNCGSEWYSPEFTRVSDLRTLRLSKLPDDPKMYAEFVTRSNLKPNKYYPIKVWQDLTNNVQTTTVIKSLSILNNIKARRLTFNDILSPKKNCFLLSLVSSIVLAFLGHTLFTLSMENSYILLVGTFFGAFMLLIEIRKF